MNISEDTLGMLVDHSEMKQESNRQRETRKFQNLWKLNSVLFVLDKKIVERRGMEAHSYNSSTL